MVLDTDMGTDTGMGTTKDNTLSKKQNTSIDNFSMLQNRFEALEILFTFAPH